MIVVGGGHNSNFHLLNVNYSFYLSYLCKSWYNTYIDFIIVAEHFVQFLRDNCSQLLSHKV